jgi:acyl-CoA thioester hydrolase
MERTADAFLPVTEVRVRFRNPAFYDDEILIRTRILSLRSRAIVFQYRALRASDNTLLAEGETHHIVRNAAGRARSLPVEYAELLRGLKATIP